MAGRAVVDPAKCDGCLLCAQVCPVNFAAGEHGKARVVDGGFCIACGHCVAVCPAGAIAYLGLDPAGFERISSDARIPYERLLAFLKTRRSRREFKDEPIPPETLKKLLDAGIQAPNSVNKQEVRYTVITDKALLKEISARIGGEVVKLMRLLRGRAGRLFFRLWRPKDYKALMEFMPLLEVMEKAVAAGIDPVLYNAPCLIIVSTSEGAAGGAEDAVYCAANIQLAAQSLGLGSCVIGFVTEPCRSDAGIRRLCRVPEGCEARTSLIVGTPKFRYTFSTPKLSPKADFIG